MLAYGDNIWTIQSHPEFQAPFVDGLIQNRGKGVVPDTQLEHAAAALPLPTDGDTIATHVAQLFKRNARA